MKRIVLAEVSILVMIFGCILFSFLGHLKYSYKQKDVSLRLLLQILSDSNYLAGLWYNIPVISFHGCLNYLKQICALFMRAVNQIKNLMVNKWLCLCIIEHTLIKQQERNDAGERKNHRLPTWLKYWVVTEWKINCRDYRLD